MKRLLLVLIALSVSFCCSAEAQHACLWQKGSLQYLGSLGGNSFASGVNDSGQVTGFSYLADGTTYHAFLWSAATGMVDLGTPLGSTFSRAYGINSAGHVVGTAPDSGTGFFWSPEGGFVAIGAPNEVLAAAAINEHDEVTGTLTSGDAFIWSPSTGLQDLGVASGGLGSYGQAINNHGLVAGYGTLVSAQNEDQALLWSPRTDSFSVVASFPGGLTIANGINDKGEIVGTNVHHSSAFGFDVDPSGNVTTLQGLSGTNGTAFAINRRGMIAGASDNAVASHAVLWKNAQSAPQDLGTFPGGTTSLAIALNNHGQVVGNSDGNVSP